MSFEDDGETGYVYALVRKGNGFAIVDAMQVYVVAAVVDRQMPVKTEIVWSSDARKSALFLNGFIYALFDFSTCRGYCRGNFPGPGAGWGRPGWSDEVAAMFNGRRRRRAFFMGRASFDAVVDRRGFLFFF